MSLWSRPKKRKNRAEQDSLYIIERFGRTIKTDDLPHEFTKSLAEYIKREGHHMLDIPTPVLFRKHHDEIFAVFPFDLGSETGIACYTRVGQHSVCSLEWLLETAPASKDEFMSLHTELTSQPYVYNLVILDDLREIGFHQDQMPPNLVL